MLNIPFQGSGKQKLKKSADKHAQPPVLLYAWSTLSGCRSYRGTGSSFAIAKSLLGSDQASCSPLTPTINISTGDICDVPRVYLLLLVPLGICVLSFTSLLGMSALLILIPVFPSHYSPTSYHGTCHSHLRLIHPPAMCFEVKRLAEIKIFLVLTCLVSTGIIQQSAKLPIIFFLHQHRSIFHRQNPKA